MNAPQHFTQETSHLLKNSVSWTVLPPMFWSTSQEKWQSLWRNSSWTVTSVRKGNVAERKKWFQKWCRHSYGIISLCPFTSKKHRSLEREVCQTHLKNIEQLWELSQVCHWHSPFNLFVFDSSTLWYLVDWALQIFRKSWFSKMRGTKVKQPHHKKINNSPGVSWHLSGHPSMPLPYKVLTLSLLRFFCCHSGLAGAELHECLEILCVLVQGLRPGQDPEQISIQVSGCCVPCLETFSNLCMFATVSCLIHGPYVPLVTFLLGVQHHSDEIPVVLTCLRQDPCCFFTCLSGGPCSFYLFETFEEQLPQIPVLFTCLRDLRSSSFRSRFFPSSSRNSLIGSGSDILDLSPEWNTLRWSDLSPNRFYTTDESLSKSHRRVHYFAHYEMCFTWFWFNFKIHWSLDLLHKTTLQMLGRKSQIQQSIVATHTNSRSLTHTDHTHTHTHTHSVFLQQDIHTNSPAHTHYTHTHTNTHTHTSTSPTWSRNFVDLILQFVSLLSCQRVISWEVFGSNSSGLLHENICVDFANEHLPISLSPLWILCSCFHIWKNRLFK